MEPKGELGHKRILTSPGAPRAESTHFPPRPGRTGSDGWILGVPVVAAAVICELSVGSISFRTILVWSACEFCRSRCYLTPLLSLNNI
uniref:Uncharacterized protein n=1 Tax=Arundo donax TaxID=35708 RepID=A0A0A9DZD7_ARUDO